MSTYGVLTGGGDCPGLNAVIRAVVRRGLHDGHRFIGFHGGWRGVRDDRAVELTFQNTQGLVTRGGTILGTSRTDPTAEGEAGLQMIRETLARHEVQALTVIGGDGTLNAAKDVWLAGIPVVGVPKTIDNDVAGTDFSVGFHTAVQIASDAIDRLHTTAESHDRVMILEVMGRRAGWIATCAGMASGADMILVPEHPYDIEAVCAHLRRRQQRGRNFSIVVVAEGARPIHRPVDELALAAPYERSAYVTEGVCLSIREQVEELTGFDTRVTILGHVQRGGTPVTFDRILASRFGVAATEAMVAGHHGVMIALHGTQVVEVDLQQALTAPRPSIDPLYAAASVFFT